jgi:hypothetical protein
MCEFPLSCRNDLPRDGPCHIVHRCKLVTSSYKNKRPEIVELESTALDHSAKVSMRALAYMQSNMYAHRCSKLLVAAATAGCNVMRQRSFRKFLKMEHLVRHPEVL